MTGVPRLCVCIWDRLFIFLVRVSYKNFQFLVSGHLKIVLALHVPFLVCSPLHNENSSLEIKGAENGDWGMERVREMKDEREEGQGDQGLVMEELSRQFWEELWKQL